MIEITRATEPDDAVRLLIGELEATLSALFPPEQRHGLPLEAIFQPHIRFFVATRAGAPVGCAGVALFADFAEIKRMYVRPAARGQGVAEALIAHLEAETRTAGLPVLRLETGDTLTAARRVYARAGFAECEAFGDYASKPAHTIATSIFMEKRLS
jgi:putative acetyltransferase